MTKNTPVYRIAKELDIDSNRIILACKSLGINAKGAAKRLSEEELEKVKNYFETGKNVSEEIVEIKNNNNVNFSVMSNTKNFQVIHRFLI